MILTGSLTKNFGDFLAVDQLNLEVGEGNVLALLGPNGAGKTTTVRMLTSLLRPTAGWALVAGYDVVKQPRLVRSSVGVLTEQHGLYDRMPAEEYLRFFGQLYGQEQGATYQGIRDLLEKFNLTEDRNRRIGEFSKGMRQKLALARALLHNPPVLLLDEPTSAMDPESARLVRDSILSLKSARRTILICTHNLNEAEELADRIAIIRKGRIIASGTPSSLKSQFLGAPEFEIQLASSLNGRMPELPANACMTSHGNTWLRVSVAQPKSTNPEVILRLFDQGFPVVTIREIPRSLEDVYLKAMSAEEPGQVEYAG
jgi:ABC-2 type transport system ATP-binding protein